MVDVPIVFEEICLRPLDHLPKDVDCLFSTDMNKKVCIKSLERLLRARGDRITLHGVKMRRPADFKEFLLNPENKIQLFDLMLKVWGSPVAASRLQNRKVRLAVRGKVYSLTCQDGSVTEQEEIHDLVCAYDTEDYHPHRCACTLSHLYKLQVSGMEEIT